MTNVKTADVLHFFFLLSPSYKYVHVHVYTCITAVLVLNTCCNLLARSHALSYSMIFGPTCIYVQVKLKESVAYEITGIRSL